MSKDTTCIARGCMKTKLNASEYCQGCLTQKANLKPRDVLQYPEGLPAFVTLPKPKPFDWRKLHGRKMEVLVGVDIAQGVDTQVVTLYDPKTKEFFVISSRQKGDNP